jgi:hypothetical protein
LLIAAAAGGSERAGEDRGCDQHPAHGVGNLLCARLDQAPAMTKLAA